MIAKTIKLIQTIFLIVVFLFIGTAAFAADKASSTEKTVGKQDQDKEQQLDYIAIVNGEKIGIADYVSALRRGMRKRFYHGKIPDDELKKFHKEVAEELVERELKIQEAKRRGIKPDAAAVDKGINDYDANFKDDPEWQKAKDTVLSVVRQKLEGDSIAQKLEIAVHEVGEPSKAELKSYYDAHHDLFTTPEQVRVALILLRVDPSSTTAVWEQANQEATSIADRLAKGAEFAELARIHSSDPSAQNGGDMGYIHAGMLGENAQKVLDLMETGETSAPVIMLEGVAIFRLIDRQKATLNPFDSVKERAVKLLKRDKGEQQWQALLAKLHKDAKIELNDAPWR